jgi:hypothetical protein
VTETTQTQKLSDQYQAISIIQMRLDTTKILADVEAFLRGTRVVGWKETEHSIEPVFGQSGEARMNAKGVQDMMSWLTLMFSPQTVQGNKSPEEFGEFMANLHGDLAEDLMNNLIEYDITLNDYNSIINKIMASADMFFSRTIDNEERLSYASTLRTFEKVGEERGVIPNIFKRGGS